MFRDYKNPGRPQTKQTFYPVNLLTVNLIYPYV